MKTTSVVIHARVAGTHNWPSGYPTFLNHEHRHEFHVNVEMEVFHNDRELEIILLKRVVDIYFQAQYLSSPETGERRFGSSSCEALADGLLSYLQEKYRIPVDADLPDGPRNISVEVLEDGELGGKVTFRRG